MNQKNFFIKLQMYLDDASNMFSFLIERKIRTVRLHMFVWSVNVIFVTWYCYQVGYLLCGLIPPDVIWALFVMIRGAALSPCTKHKTTSAIQSCTLHMPPQKHKTLGAKHRFTKEIFFKKIQQNSNTRSRGLRFGVNRWFPAKMQMNNVNPKVSKLFQCH